MATMAGDNAERGGGREESSRGERSSVTLYKFESTWGLPSFSHDCVYLETYLRLCGVRFSEEKYSSENASPTGALPAIDIDGLALGEGDEQEGDLESSGADVASIVKNLKGNGIDLDAGLSKEDFADLNAYLALVDNSLLPATLWALWCDDQSYCEFTRKFYSQMYPFPLSHIFPWTRRRAVLGRLGSMNIKHENQVLALVDKAYSSLARKLKDKKYFFGRPTSLDAKVYSHLLYHSASPGGRLLFNEVLNKYPALAAFSANITASHFGASNTAAKRDADFTASPLKRKRKKKKQETQEEKLFAYRRNAWLLTTFGITAAFLASSILENIQLLEEE